MSKQNYSKAKGRDAENAVVKFLLEHGFHRAERRRLTGANDRGDIAGVDDLTIEVKAEKRIDLAGYMKELAAEVENTGDEFGVAFVKRRGTTDVGEWYAVMPVSWFVRLWKRRA